MQDPTWNTKISSCEKVLVSTVLLFCHPLTFVLFMNAAFLTSVTEMCSYVFSWDHGSNDI